MVIRLMLGATLPEIYKRALKPPTLERITHFMKQKCFCNCPSFMATKRFVFFFTIIIIIILCHPQPCLLTRPFPTLVPKATLAIITSLKTNCWEYHYLTFSLSLFTRNILTSASSSAAHTSLSIAPRTCWETNTNQYYHHVKRCALHLKSEINLMIIMIHSCPVWWYKWHRDFEEQIVGIAIGFLCEVKKNCAIT